MKSYNDDAIRSTTAATRNLWIVVLLIHFYIEGYTLWSSLGWSHPMTDRILAQLLKTGWLCPLAARGLVIIYMEIMLFIEPSKKEWSFDYKEQYYRNRNTLFIGFILYFGCYWVLAWPLPFIVTFIGYMILTLTGIRLFYMGLSGLMRMLKVPGKANDPLGKELAGFPQLEDKVESPFSLHLRGQYKYRGEERSSWINLINPRRGIFIVASPGGGKSWFIIEPLMQQWLAKGNAMFLYDFKYDALTRVAYHYFNLYRERFPPSTNFYSINFKDITRSHRCNLIHPSSLEWISDAIGVSRTILLSINPNWPEKQGEFFVESPINFLAAVIWFLRQYKEGIYCTLPHAIELACLPYRDLFCVLGKCEEIRSLIDPFKEAWENETYEMLDGQIASARIPLGRLASPDIYYILTGNDLTLDINNPLAPKILCLGGDPVRQDALGPVLSLYIDRVNRICNRPEQHPCAIICDEFATVRANSMATVIATGRSHNIVPIIAVQDLSQLRINYTRNEADLFLNASGNLFCGQVGGETAKWVSERFPQIQQERQTVGTSSDDTNLSITRHWEPALTAAAIGALSSGEFVGVLSDDPGTLLDTKIFHAKLIRQEPALTDLPELPVVRNVGKEEITACFLQIGVDIQQIVTDSKLKENNKKEDDHEPTENEEKKSKK